MSECVNLSAEQRGGGGGDDPEEHVRLQRPEQWRPAVRHPQREGEQVRPFTSGLFHRRSVV